MQNIYQNRTRSYKKIIIVSIAILLLVLGLLYYNHAHHSSSNASYNSSGSKTIVKGTVSKPVTHPNTPSTSNSNPVQGSATTQNNQTSTSTIPPSSQWTTSTSGAITLQQPYSNDLIKSGVTISGTANSSVNTINYILTDNSVGQIAQGSLNVINGKFSGKIDFTSHSTKGTLQVYSPNPANGAEENIINVNVNYN